MVTVNVRNDGYTYQSIFYEAIMVLRFYLMHLYELPQVMKGTGNPSRIMLSAALGIVLLSAAFFSDKLMHVSRLALVMVWCSGFSLSTQGGCLPVDSWHGSSIQEHYTLAGTVIMQRSTWRIGAHDLYSGVVIDGYVSKMEKQELGKYLSSYEKLESIVDSLNPDGLVVLKLHETQFMKYVMDAAGKEGIYLQLIPFLNDVYPAHPTSDLVGTAKLINLRATPPEKAGKAPAQDGLRRDDQQRMTMLTARKFKKRWESSASLPC